MSWGAYAAGKAWGDLLGGLVGGEVGLEGAFIGNPEYMIFLAGHLKIGPNSVLGARTGVTKSLPGGNQYMGFPVATAAEERRRLVGLRRIPDIVKRLKRLEEGESE